MGMGRMGVWWAFGAGGGWVEGFGRGHNLAKPPHCWMLCPEGLHNKDSTARACKLALFGATSVCISRD